MSRLDRGMRPVTLGVTAVAVALTVWTWARFPMTTGAIFTASIVMFLVSGWACITLYGHAATAKFVLLALGLGWFAEQMGSSYGWFFGSYVYTDVLGARLGNVPISIPLMWFSLAFVGLTLANFILWRTPTLEVRTHARIALTAFFAAMLITAFDLGADPYFVFVLKAWIMKKTDGGWFGETLQGFLGWMLVAFVLILAFFYVAKPTLARTAKNAIIRATLVPIVIYAGFVGFQMALGHPIEVRAIAAFAMGIPLVAACVARTVWKAGL